MTSEESIKDYYEKNPEGIPGTPDIPEIYQAHQLFLRQLEKLRPTSLLDAGCGKGYLGASMRPLVRTYTGFDISSSAVEIAATRIPDALFQTGSITRLPFENESFDCVVCSEVLEHVPEYREAVKELARVTRQNGTILISTPNRFNPDMLWRLALYGKYTEQVFDRPISHTELRAVFQQNGLDVEKFLSFFFLPLWGERIPRPIKKPLMNLHGRFSQITGIPLGLYLFFRLRKL